GAVAATFLFIVGDALPRSLARVAPELAATALPLARRTLAPFGLLLWLLAWVDKGLHGLVATRRPLEPDLGAAQRDMLLGVFTLADTRVDEVMTPRLDMVAVDLAAPSDDVIEAFRHSEHPRRDRRREPGRTRRGRSPGDPSGRRPLLGRRPSHARRPFTGARAPVRASGGLDRGWARLLGAGAGAPRRRRADARWLSGRRGAGRPTPRDQRAAAEATVTLPAVLLLLGLILAAASAAIGVAAAAVSQLELTRWVSYKLRGAGGAAGVLENPGRVLATANALTTVGIICAAAAMPALLARTTPTVLGVFTIALGIPLLVSAAYLVP